MYQSHVFLEVRILVAGDTKAFCSCPTGPQPGSCPVCRREEGQQPLVNSRAVRKAYTLAHALDCTLAENAPYERPRGSPSLTEPYTVTGASLKIATDGVMEIEFHKRLKKIRITEVRIEEDTGRLTHSNGETHMDFTNAGAASIRIRTGADFELGEEAEIFLTELGRRIQYMGILRIADYEEVIRCNAYVALARYPEMADYSVKLRNLNSFNFVRKAINAELHRQEEILTSGGSVSAESRLWNERQDRTEFYQERGQDSSLKTTVLPGSQIFVCPANLLAELRAAAIEHPSSRKRRLASTWALSPARAEFICDEKNRADFFEHTIAAGADAMDTAHWLMSDVTGLLRRHGQKIQESPLSPRRFATILKLFHEKKIHSKIAKQLLQAVLETDKDPEELLVEHNWHQITDTEQLQLLVQRTIDENPQEAARLREGDMAPLEYLTGTIMKRTKGLADPLAVKTLLREQLHISLVYILSMGGAISGSCEDGEVSAGDERVLRALVDGGISNKSIRFETITRERLLSEEIQPADWAALIHAIARIIASGTANGIVIAHGTDTLAYTAALIYWLFADSPVPIVFTASNTSPSAGNEARTNLNKAVQLAEERTKGVYVSFAGKTLSPLNLKFLKPAPAGFANWNQGEPVFSGTGLMSGYSETDRYVMSRILCEAADRLFMCRVFPGLRADRLISLIDSGVQYFVLELYEKGTGNMKVGDYSLKQLFIQGRRRNCRFYCTSQQECPVDLSGYTTSRRMWREGAVPMGALTTESVVGLYFAASLVCDSVEEFEQIMESGSPA